MESANVPAACEGTQHKPKFMDRLQVFLGKRRAYRARSASVCRIVAGYIHYHGLRRPSELGSEHVSAFLAHLRKTEDLSPEQELEARGALALLYEKFLPADEGAESAGGSVQA